MKVTVWGEGFLDVEALPEDDRPVNYADYVDEARRIYPDDVHAALAAGLASELGPQVTVRTAVLDDPRILASATPSSATRMCSCGGRMSSTR